VKVLLFRRSQGAQLFQVSACTPTSAFPQKPAANWENLCRYAGRPAVATERLSVLPDGRLLYRLRHRWRNGATHVVFEPLEFELLARVPIFEKGPSFHL
jgi:hypothetical protein